MSELIDPLVRDLVAWCAAAPRSYAEVTDAWRTSCPRLTVWEEAVGRGLIMTCAIEGRLMVEVTRAGHAHIAPTMALRSPRPQAPAAAAPMRAVPTSSPASSRHAPARRART